MAKRGQTQRITAADIRAGSLRVSQSELSALPSANNSGEIPIVLKGRALGDCRYDSREGADGRSARIGIGVDAARTLLHEGERLPIVTSVNGTVYLGDRGSRLRICEWVNDDPNGLETKVLAESATLRDFASAPVIWVSPLRADDYAELADDLWSRLALPEPSLSADRFWPARQPNWDAVGTVEGVGGNRGVILVEAKSHVAEVNSTCKASDPQSRTLITQALDTTKEYLGVPPATDWLTPHYQAANRLAFLYYLRVKRNIPTWLFFVYFVGDAFEVNGSPQECPVDATGWGATLASMHATLGLPSPHRLEAYVADVFLPVAP